jgi:putative tryptophan/tyrosine transport system substrate-binding protein
MRRREFITLFGGVATGLTFPAKAQQAGKIAHIGYLSVAAGRNSLDETFEQTLQQLGWIINLNIIIEYRYAGGRQDMIAPITEEAIRSHPDALVIWGPPLALAAKRMTTQIPVIFLMTFDPVEVGLVSNLANPGGNLTGVTGLASLEIFSKRLQLLKEIAPSVTRVAVLVSTEQTLTSGGQDALTAAARVLGLELERVEVGAPSGLALAINAAKSRGSQAVYVWPSGFTFSFAKEISDVTTASGLPSITFSKEGVLAGALLAYAADLKELVRHGAAYVDKILKGTPPGTLPVEQSARYELLVNLKTAKALGLTIPPAVMLAADEVIE